MYQWFERFGSVCGCIDIFNAMLMKHSRSYQQNTPGSDLGNDHAGIVIDTHTADEYTANTRAFAYFMTALITFLNFLRSLPKEHIRRNSSAQHTRDNKQKRETELNMRGYRRFQHGTPVLVYNKNRDGISQ